MLDEKNAPIRIMANDEMSINVDNLSDKNAQDFAAFNLTLSKEGQILEDRSFTLDIEPEHNYWVFTEPDKELAPGEYIYTLSCKTSGASEYGKKGTPLASAQKIFTVEGAAEDVPARDFTVEDDGQNVMVEGKDYTMVFSKEKGGLVSLSYDGKEMIAAKPEVSYWRASDPLDYNNGTAFENAPWLSAGMFSKHLPEKYWYADKGEAAELTFVFAYPITGGMETAVIYTVEPGGKLSVKTTYEGLATFRTLPAYALDFKLPKELDSLRFYGYGPDENYIDTTEGLLLDVYQTTVRKNFKKNDIPQETGNRTGVRWADVYNAASGKGLRFTSNTEPMNFSALPYSAYEIEAAGAADELPKITATTARAAACLTGVGTDGILQEWAKPDAGDTFTVDVTIEPVVVEKKKPVRKAAAKPKTAAKAAETAEKPARKPRKTAASKTEQKTADESLKAETAKTVSKDKTAEAKTDAVKPKTRRSRKASTAKPAETAAVKHEITATKTEKPAIPTDKIEKPAIRTDKVEKPAIPNEKTEKPAIPTDKVEKPVVQ